MTLVDEMRRWVCYLMLLQNFARIVKATRKASCNGWTLTAPDEGNFECNPLGVTISMPGTRCILSCDAGYRPQHEVLVCSEKGGWVPTNSPECEADSTMTLVIVLSIVGSIIVILALSVVFARTSKRCQGKRRKQEDDDPESGTKRRENQDTSTYYGQVKRMRRKRRLQAERQRKITEMKRRKEGTVDKTITKQPVSRHKKETKGGTEASSKDTPNDRGVKRTKERRKEQRSLPKKKVISSKKATPPRKVISPRKTPEKKQQKNISLQERLTNIFCLFCTDNESRTNRTQKRDGGVLSVSKNLAPMAKKPPPASSSSSSSSSSSLYSSSSSSESSSEEDEAPPKKEAKKIDDGKTPSSRSEKPKKPPQKPPRQKPPPKKPPPPNKKKPPPRPPAPAFPNRATKISSDALDNSDSPGCDVMNPKGISSGYSSEGERQKRKRGHSESGMRKNSSKDNTTRPQSAAGGSSKNRMEVMSPGPDTENKETGNPYEHYPAALSYRQYQNFENDYRRTTGDYHPQYSNVKLIPLESMKKPTEDNKAVECEEKTAKEKPKPVQGGVKYISISEEEGGDEDSDSDEPKSRRNKKKRAERYEEPSARDGKKNSPDCHGRQPTKRAKKDTKPKDESRSKRQRKKQIEGEMIIDAGKGTRVEAKTNAEKKKSNETRKTKTKNGCHEKSKPKKRPK